MCNGIALKDARCKFNLRTIKEFFFCYENKDLKA